jgi:hypothetical protein
VLVAGPIFGAIRPERGVGAGLVLPWCNSVTMSLRLAEISQAVSPGAQRARRPRWSRHVAGLLVEPTPEEGEMWPASSAGTRPETCGAPALRVQLDLPASAFGTEILDFRAVSVGIESGFPMGAEMRSLG